MCNKATEKLSQKKMCQKHYTATAGTNGSGLVAGHRELGGLIQRGLVALYSTWWSRDVASCGV